MLESVVIGVLGLGVYSVWSALDTYDRLMVLDEQCTTAFADVNAFLKHRHDLIPGLVQNVRSYVGRENRALNRVLQARAQAQTTKNHRMETRFDAEYNLGHAINSLFASLEHIPNANTLPHFIELRNSFKNVENRLMTARQTYNLSAKKYNATLCKFSGRMLAARYHLTLRRQYTNGLSAA